MTRTARVPGFYRLDVRERRRRAAELLGIEEAELALALERGGIDIDTADRMIENVLGTYALPFALGLNFLVDGRERLLPMVVEEPSVVAAASNAARMVRAGGGFHTEADPPVMIAQVQLEGVADPSRATERIERETPALLSAANACVPNLLRYGGGARSLEVRSLGEGTLVVHVLVDCRDAMGANLVNTVAEGIADRLAELAGARVGLRILSNLADHRTVTVRCRVPAEALRTDRAEGEAVRDGIVAASRFAERDPYRAATHNKGIMNGVDAVVLATGNDWRAVEAGAHAYAAAEGRYQPLCTWRVGEEGALLGELRMPMALGVVGGPIRVHPGARLALRLAEVRDAQDLAALAAAAGMASNLAALRALATDGIQRGHMRLHARAVAAAAGAEGEMVDRVAATIHAEGRVTLDAARAALARLQSDAAE